MGEFADISAVELAWNQLVPDDSSDHVDYLIDKAERLVRARVPSLADRITAEKITTEDVSDVVCDMVIRVLRNPDGYRYEAAGDYSYQRDSSVATGTLALTTAELARLRGNPGQVTSVPVGDDALIHPLRRPLLVNGRRGWRYGWPV